MTNSPGATKEQDIAIGVLEREATQTVLSIFEWLAKLDITRSKLGRQRVRLGDGNESVPASDALLNISRVVRHWRYANGFEQDLSATPANDAEEDVVRSRPLESDLKAKPITVERQRRRNIVYDQEG
jgi:hypothetical protein